VLIRAAAWLLLVTATFLPPVGSALAAPETIVPTATAPTTPPTTPPTDTTFDFWPEDRNIGDCVSALPKPGCGSEARGGWAQTAVFGAILLGFSFIAWRIVRSARRAKASS